MVLPNVNILPFLRTSQVCSGCYLFEQLELLSHAFIYWIPNTYTLCATDEGHKGLLKHRWSAANDECQCVTRIIKQELVSHSGIVPAYLKQVTGTYSVISFPPTLVTDVNHAASQFSEKLSPSANPIFLKHSSITHDMPAMWVDCPLDTQPNLDSSKHQMPQEMTFCMMQ